MESNGQIPGYPVDLVLCIDATLSMRPILEEVKSRARSFHDDLLQEMEAKGKFIDMLRIRVVVFRDLGVDGDQAMAASDFFRMPEEADPFAAFVSSIEALGGGDEPESGLEALSVAFASPWSTGVKRRQVIIVWTDASAHALNGHGGALLERLRVSPPADFDELTDRWQGQMASMDPSAQRLILYAPDAYPWTDISNYWENTLHHVSRGGAGLSDLDYNTIVDVIASSV